MQTWQKGQFYFVQSWRLSGPTASVLASALNSLDSSLGDLGAESRNRYNTHQVLMDVFFD